MKKNDDNNKINNVNTHHYPNTGGWVAAKGVDVDMREPERFLMATKADALSREVVMNIYDYMINGGENTFMNDGDIPDDYREILKAIDTQYGTTFEYGFDELKKKYLECYGKVVGFSNSLGAFAKNELE